MARPYKNKHQKTNSPFKRLRLNIRLSQEQLAREIGVAVSTIRRWEKGQAEPTMTVAQMKKFCLIVKKDFQELPDSLLPSDRHADIVSNITSRLNQEAEEEL